LSAELRTSFEDLVQEISANNIGDSSSSISSHPLKKAKKLLDDMIANIDELSKDFDRLATSSYSSFSAQSKESRVDIGT